MNILGIETTSAFASVAVLDRDGRCTEVVSDGELNHLQNLLPMVEEVLSKSGLEKTDLDALAVSRGPGSFTGVRIGVSTVKALAQVLGIEIAQVPTLFAMAYGMRHYRAVICPILNARRNQVYSAAYCFKDEDLEVEIFPEGAYGIEEVAAFLEVFEIEGYDKVLFMGDGVEEFREKVVELLGDKAIFAAPEERIQRASSVAEIGKRICLAGESVDYVTAEPEYLRKSEAERNLEMKQKNEASEGVQERKETGC